MKKRFTPLVLGLVLCMSLSVIPAMPARAAEGLGVESRTKDEILDYLDANGAKKYLLESKAVTYKTKPDETAPYANIGELSDETKNDFIKIINSVRYITGLDANVTWNDNYAKLTQAAAVVNYANSGLNHHPDKPAGMDDTVFSLGYEGSGKSNLGMGYNSVWGTVVDGWMEDDNESNRDRVGHRRWVINPPMGQSALGFVGTLGSASAMYAFDGSNSSSKNKVAWPAQNTPLDYFRAGVPWSLSIGSEINKSSVSVTLTDKKTGKSWKFGNAGNDGYFNVENSRYGMPGCIIFTPESIKEYKDGDAFDVAVSIGSRNIEYTVNFFNVDSYGGRPVYRLYNKSTGAHIYTFEKDRFNSYAWNVEGMVTKSASIRTGLPLYEVYNSNNGDYHYTTNAAERDNLVKAGWTDNGIAYCVTKSGKPVYRMYNPNKKGAGSHHYTASEAEKNTLLKTGWKYEGVAWYQ